MAGKSALPLIALAGGAALLMSRKKKKKKATTTNGYEVLPDDNGFELPPIADDKKPPPKKTSKRPSGNPPGGDSYDAAYWGDSTIARMTSIRQHFADLGYPVEVGPWPMNRIGPKGEFEVTNQDGTKGKLGGNDDEPSDVVRRFQNEYNAVSRCLRLGGDNGYFLPLFHGHGVPLQEGEIEPVCGLLEGLMQGDDLHLAASAAHQVSATCHRPGRVLLRPLESRPGISEGRYLLKISLCVRKEIESEEISVLLVTREGEQPLYWEVDREISGTEYMKVSGKAVVVCSGSEYLCVSGTAQEKQVGLSSVRIRNFGFYDKKLGYAVFRESGAAEKGAAPLLAGILTIATSGLLFPLLGSCIQLQTAALEAWGLSQLSPWKEQER